MSDDTRRFIRPLILQKEPGLRISYLLCNPSEQSASAGVCAAASASGNSGSNASGSTGGLGEQEPERSPSGGCDQRSESTRQPDPSINVIVKPWRNVCTQRIDDTFGLTVFKRKRETICPLLLQLKLVDFLFKQHDHDLSTPKKSICKLTLPVKLAPS